MQYPEPLEDIEQMKCISTDILIGLSHLHEKGVIHSDIKPHNALLHEIPPDEREDEDNPQIVKLCDFGLAHLMEPEHKGFGLMKERCGTMGYIAPEVKQHNTLVSPAIDMWAFGVMLYEMHVAYKPTQF